MESLPIASGRSAVERTRWARALSIAVTLSIALSAAQLPQAGSAQADTHSPPEAIVDLVATAAEAVGAHHPGATPFVEDELGVAAAGEESLVDFTDGEISLLTPGAELFGIGLPGDAPTEGTVTADGTLVLTSDDADYEVAIQAYDDGAVRVQTVIPDEHATSSFAYDLVLPDGAVLLAREDGGVDVVMEVPAEPAGTLSDSELEALLPFEELVDAEEARAAVAVDGDLAEWSDAPAEGDVVLVASVAPPWALDANGVVLPTHYVVTGDQLVQVVDTSAAAFPVVADPFFVPMVWVGLSTAARLLAPWAMRAYMARRIQVGVMATRGGFTSFQRFKNVYGSKTGYHWHHIVEQRHAAGFGATRIHNTNNLIAIPARVHQACVNKWMATKHVRGFGIYSGNQTMRAHIGSMRFERQHQIGVALLRHCGVPI